LKFNQLAKVRLIIDYQDRVFLGGKGGGFTHDMKAFIGVGSDLLYILNVTTLRQASKSYVILERLFDLDRIFDAEFDDMNGKGPPPKRRPLYKTNKLRSSYLTGTKPVLATIF
jgi:hypothetical protein